METLAVTVHSAAHLEGCDVATLDAILARIRSARACLDGYEALVGSALERARRRSPCDVPRPGPVGSEGPGGPGSSPDGADDAAEGPDDAEGGGGDRGSGGGDGAVAPPLSAREARKVRERALRLASHPDVRDALLAGRITTEQADVLTNADLATGDISLLLAAALSQTTDETRSAVRQAVRARHERTGARRLTRQRHQRRGSCGIDDDGMIWFWARLDPATGTPLKEEYDRRENRAYRQDLETRDQWKRRTATQRGADVITDMLTERLLGDGPAAATSCACSQHPPRRPALDLIADLDILSTATAEVLAHTSNGIAVPAELARASLCIADIRLWFTNTTRTELFLGTHVELATPTIRQALLIRDGSCRWRGCTVEASRCEAHHLTFRRDGGPSDITNFALLCPRHHTYLHTIAAHLRMGHTADQWMLIDDHTGQVIDRWTTPTPRRARAPDERDTDHAA